MKNRTLFPGDIERLTLRGFREQADYDLIAEIRNDFMRVRDGGNANIIDGSLIKNIISDSDRLRFAEIDREPVDSAHLFLSDIEHLYCYTSVNNPFDNNIIVHHWYSNNIEYFNYPIEVGNSDNWRCWSMITIRPQLAGEWMVSATDTLGNILAQTEFTILETEE